MLTCLIGNEKIHIFDYKRDTLKEWSNKGILKCPVCGETYEYCHGEFNKPYFRHKDKVKCEDYYSESETEEHEIGKELIYKTLLNMEGIADLDLESWIPETKQRPDIYFKYNNEKYVIEYQCTPIATEYIERHRLYQASGIKDIWILGTEKYDLNYYIRGNKTNEFHRVKLKTIEREIVFGEGYNLCYFDYITKSYYVCRNGVDIFGLNGLKTTFNIKLSKYYYKYFKLNNFIKTTHSSVIKYNICQFIKRQKVDNIFNLKKDIINPLICFNVNNQSYGIEYINRMLSEEDISDIKNNYEYKNIIPILLFNSNIYEINNRNNVFYQYHYKLINFGYVPIENKILTLKYDGDERRNGYFSQYYVGRYLVKATAIKNLSINTLLDGIYKGKKAQEIKDNKITTINS
jgi:hypothetical protein